MTKAKLKQIRSLIFEMEEEKERQYILGAWSLLNDTQEQIKKNKQSLNLLLAWIDEVPDVLVRRAIKLRFVDGKSWTEVSLKMGYTSPDGARKLVSRYLAKKSV